MKVTAKAEWNKYDDLHPADYLSHLVALKKALHGLNRHPDINLCNNDLSVHVYQGLASWQPQPG